MALKSLRNYKRMYPTRIWRWNGYLIQVSSDNSKHNNHLFVLKICYLLFPRNAYTMYMISTVHKNKLILQYTVAGHGGPSVLLVHGFGAFYEHYRDNISAIASGGNRVWALTVLGFGKSEKPNVVYTELMWAQLVRDFIVEVVGEPVHLAGNSIGGMLYQLLIMFRSCKNWFSN